MQVVPSHDSALQLPSSDVVNVAVAESLLESGSVEVVVIVAVFETEWPPPMQLLTWTLTV